MFFLAVFVMSLQQIGTATEDSPDVKDPFAGIYISPFRSEYPFDRQQEQLMFYKVVSWQVFFSKKNNELVEGQLDGFLKVKASKVADGVNKGKTVYAYLLYKTKEDMKYRRLGSCLVLKSDVSQMIDNNLTKDDYSMLDGKYCIAAGIFRRQVGTESSIGSAIKLTELILK